MRSTSVGLRRAGPTPPAGRDDRRGRFHRSIIAGLEWALEEKCEIISMSIGAETALGDEPVDDYERIGDICLDAGTLIIAAAGNESARPGRIAPVGSPANASTIMAVAGIDQALGMYEGSCGGMNPNQDVDIAAPVFASVPRWRRGAMPSSTERAWRPRTWQALRR
jgi:hypothetical protein